MQSLMEGGVNMGKKTISGETAERIRSGLMKIAREDFHEELKRTHGNDKADELISSQEAQLLVEERVRGMILGIGLIAGQLESGRLRDESGVSQERCTDIASSIRKFTWLFNAERSDEPCESWS